MVRGKVGREREREGGREGVGEKANLLMWTAN